MRFTVLPLCIDSTSGVSFSHNPAVVVASFVAAVLGSYAALEIAERSLRPNAIAWRLASAATLAIAIWCMHFVGILAITEPRPLDIAPGPTLLSLAVAVAAVTLGYLCVKPAGNRWFHFLGAGVLIGIGMVLMHFIGMQGVLLPVTVAYRPWLAGLSVAIAISAASLAVVIAYTCHNRQIRLAAAIVMAAGMCGMHYTAMAAANMPFQDARRPEVGFPRVLLVGAITIAVAFLLLLALISAASDRRLIAAAVQEMTLLKSAHAVMLQTQEEFVRRLAAVAESRDTDTGKHILRLGALSQGLALAAGCSPEFAHQLSLAAMLHDIGKIGIADDVLLKRGHLTAEERQVMQRHAALGHQMLSGSGLPLLDMAAEIAWCHHEWWDGSGYPRGLRREEIPLAARIVTIADVADALLSARPYKHPWPLEQVLMHLAGGANIHFDPHLIEVLLENVTSVFAVWLPQSSTGGMSDHGHDTEAALHAALEIPRSLPLR